MSVRIGRFRLGRGKREKVRGTAKPEQLAENVRGLLSELVRTVRRDGLILFFGRGSDLEELVVSALGASDHPTATGPCTSCGVHAEGLIARLRGQPGRLAKDAAQLIDDNFRATPVGHRLVCLCFDDDLRCIHWPVPN
jgi:hypothetical protein